MSGFSPMDSDSMCPDWRDLEALRMNSAATDTEEARWSDALDHAAGCQDCGPRAVDADPLALLRPLGADIAALEGGMDVERMQASVEALRRGQRAQKEPRFTAMFGTRYAAAAALAVTLVGLGVVGSTGVGGTGVGSTVIANGPSAEPTSTALISSPDVNLDSMPWTDPLDAFAEPTESYAELPVFDDLQRPAAASVYQLAEDDLHVVMVVHETLDV